MRRYLVLPALAAAVSLLAIGYRATAQQGETFGGLKSVPASTSLPTGIEPMNSAAPSPTPNPFPLTVECGQWMICASHFIGFEGADLAKQMVLDLRNRHNLNAVLFNRGDEERRKQDEEWEQYKAKFPPGTPLRRRRARIQDEWAVLIGGFADSAAASAFLPKVKALPIPELKLENGRCPFEVMTVQELDPKTQRMVPRQGLVNPYWHAMVVKNPLLANAPSKNNWDPSWPHLNAGEEYSLLNNPKPYTLMIKKYSGRGIIQAGASESGNGKGMLGNLFGSSAGESLCAAGSQAHELARFLRDPKSFGFKAYVLHTKYSSIVTVGEFSSPEDPELIRVKQQLANMCFTTQPQYRDPRNPDPIGLMTNPVVILVPRP